MRKSNKCSKVLVAIQTTNLMMARLCLFGGVLIIWSCASPPGLDVEQPVTVYQGEAQGSTYSVKFLNPDSVVVLQSKVFSILKIIDLSLSTWVKTSTISQFNQSDSVFVRDHHFMEVFRRGKEISEKTGGAFHPMIMPVVRAWGFGPEGGQMKEGVNLDSLRRLVHFDFDVSETADGWIFQKPAGVQLDVNSFAQGYTVDVIADFLESRNIHDYMVEVGGELKASGRNQTGEFWRIGIDKPLETDAARELNAIVTLDDAAMATSGTYRKFYVRDGKKYSHTIDPVTAAPVDHNLLSVTVMAKTCLEADAYATAFMVMGVEKARDFIQENPDLKLEIYLIYDAGEDGLKTYTSKGLEEATEEL